MTSTVVKMLLLKLTVYSEVRRNAVCSDATIDFSSMVFGSVPDNNV